MFLLCHQYLLRSSQSRGVIGALRSRRQDPGPVCPPPRPWWEKDGTRPLASHVAAAANIWRQFPHLSPCCGGVGASLWCCLTNYHASLIFKTPEAAAECVWRSVCVCVCVFVCVNTRCVRKQIYVCPETPWLACRDGSGNLPPAKRTLVIRSRSAKQQGGGQANRRGRG